MTGLYQAIFDHKVKITDFRVVLFFIAYYLYYIAIKQTKIQVIIK